MTEKFHVIIVGAAAYSLAKKSFNMLILERGKYPGAKNVMGGRMYAHAMNRFIPEFWKELSGKIWKILMKSQWKGLVSILFTLRFWIDKIFPLDRNINTLPIPGCKETSVKTRLNSEDLKKSKAGKAIKGDDSSLEFRPVYLFDDESLHELSNDTVHGLIHVGWIKKNDNNYTATLAIYVIPRGIYGKVYLKLIEPFRRHIVYPGMMKAIKEQWQEYLLSKG